MTTSKMVTSNNGDDDDDNQTASSNAGRSVIGKKIKMFKNSSWKSVSRLSKHGRRAIYLNLLQDSNNLNFEPFPTPFNEIRTGLIKARPTTCTFCHCEISMIVSIPFNICHKCLEEDRTRGLPKRFLIKHCRHCQSYSYSGSINNCIRAPPQSKELLDFLLKKLEFYMEYLRLQLVDARFSHTQPDSKTIKIELSLQLEAPHNGAKLETLCNIEFLVVYQSCPSCSSLIACSSLIGAISNKWCLVVQLRQEHPSYRRTLLVLEHLILRHKGHVRNMRPTDQGTDFFFATNKEALVFLNLLCSLAPVKCDKNYKKLLSGGQRSKISSNRSCITASVCPICPEDLVYLPSKVSYILGNLGGGPLGICTKVCRNIIFVNPWNSRVCILKGDDYWREPFLPLRTRLDLVKYIVLDVEMVCSSLANIQVARVSDFGKNDLIFTVRSHLGRDLKVGDYALGYHLKGANMNDDEAEKCRDLIPDVVLVKKVYQWEEEREKKAVVAAAAAAARKKSSPEYEEFLRELEKNPEALFNLSLKSGDEEKQQHSELASATMRDEQVDVELEVLLADLALRDEVGDSSRKF